MKVFVFIIIWNYMKLFIILYASQKQHKIFLRICIIATKIQENGKVFHKSYSPKKMFSMETIMVKKN